MPQTLSAWIETCLRRVRSDGTFSIIMRADKLDEILEAMRTKCGAMRILPISARTNSNAKRVIVQGIKARQSPTELLAPFVMHQGDRHTVDGDSYTKQALDVLRGGATIAALAK